MKVVKKDPKTTVRGISINFPCTGVKVSSCNVCTLENAKDTVNKKMKKNTLVGETGRSVFFL